MPIHISSVARPTPFPKGRRPKTDFHYQRPLTLWDVYVDDFLGLIQCWWRTKVWVKCDLLHSLDSILRPLDAQDPPINRNRLLSRKWPRVKSACTTINIILGWILNTSDNTISLPAHLLVRVRDILASIRPTQR
jgi:hypothetical protein